MIKKQSGMELDGDDAGGSGDSSSGYSSNRNGW